jgi:hypothetical protein
MTRAIALRDNHTANAVRKRAAKTKNADQGCRLLAAAAACDGLGRSDAAHIGSKDGQTVRD